jgi:hypothetical protein
MAQQVEDLKVWQRSREFCVAVNALLGRAGFQRDRKLKEQLSNARLEQGYCSRAIEATLRTQNLPPVTKSAMKWRG